MQIQDKQTIQISFTKNTIIYTKQYMYYNEFNKSSIFWVAYLSQFGS